MQPNSDNLVLNYPQKYEEISKLKRFLHWALGGRRCRMSSKIIKRTQLLKKKTIKQNKHQEKKRMPSKIVERTQVQGKNIIEQNKHQEKDELIQKISNIESNLTHISKQLTLLMTAKKMKKK